MFPDETGNYLTGNVQHVPSTMAESVKELIGAWQNASFTKAVCLDAFNQYMLYICEQKK